MCFICKHVIFEEDLQNWIRPQTVKLVKLLCFIYVNSQCKMNKLHGVKWASTY